MTPAEAISTPFLRSRGGRAFLIIWVGQLISAIGSALTSFGLGIWVYEETSSTTLYALNLLAFSIPLIVVAPFTGALVDRMDRRTAMIIGDAGSGLSTLAIVVLYVTGGLRVWHVPLATLINSTFYTLQWPAWAAAQTLLVPKEHLGRAGGMVQIGEAVGELLAPVAAGVLFYQIGIGGIAALDFATFVVAILTLLIVRVPRPEVSAVGQAARGTLLKEARTGFQYILARKPLLALLGFFAAQNFLSGMLYALFAPLLLDASTPQVFGLVSSIIALGMLVGTLFMSVWGGPKRKINGLMGFSALTGVFAFFIGFRLYVPLISAAGFAALFTVPVVYALNQAIWQSKVEPDVQGRVFSVRTMIGWATDVPALLVAGPLVDIVFQPLMAADGPLAGTLIGQVLTLGPGRGAGALFMINGLLMVLICALFYLLPVVRHVETLLPDAVGSIDPDETRAPVSEAASP